MKKTAASCDGSHLLGLCAPKVIREKCSICSKVFSSKFCTSLHQHFHRSNNAKFKRLSCDVCSKKFRRVLSFNKHKNFHQAGSAVHSSKAGENNGSHRSNNRISSPLTHSRHQNEKGLYESLMQPQWINFTLIPYIEDQVVMCALLVSADT